MAATIDPAKLQLVKDMVKADNGWAVLPTARPDGTVQSSVVTATLMDHPKTGEPVIGFLCRGGTVKQRNMRRCPSATITFRGGSKWVTVEGKLTMVGPEDSAEGFDQSEVPTLLRGIEQSLRGENADWAAFDKNMADQRRAAAYISLDRVYSNP